MLRRRWSYEVVGAVLLALLTLSLQSQEVQGKGLLKYQLITTTKPRSSQPFYQTCSADLNQESPRYGGRRLELRLESTRRNIAIRS